jgi:hypothetical protein
VLLVSLFVLLIFAYRPAARPEIAPPWAVPGWFPREWSPMSGEPRPTPATMDGASLERANLSMTSAEGLYTDDEQVSLADEVNRALNYTAERFGSTPSDEISVYIGLDEGCNLNGLAYTDQRLTQVFTCAALPRNRVVNILAHEFVHQLAHDRYGAAHLQADMILAEGLATWGAGEYWLGSEASFREFVRHHYHQSGQIIPLATSYVGRPISDMNTLYYEWASFVEYLISTYGRNKFDALYVSGSKEPGSADYAGVYGKSLDELEQEWLAWLEA